MKLTSYLWMVLPWSGALPLALCHGNVAVSPLDSQPELWERDDVEVLTRTNVSAGTAVKPNTTLRILCVGDSITYGRGSDQNGGDGNGYRLQLEEDLSADEVLYLGTEKVGTMEDGYFAGWPGKTIQYIADHVGASLEQKPNIILLHAGTNDMDSSATYSTEGNDPTAAAERLGNLIDQMIEACPEAVILVAVILSSCDSRKVARTPEYQALIPGVVEKRRSDDQKVLAVDFSDFPLKDLRDCIHPTNAGYRKMGDWWYDYITQIPTDWIQDPTEDESSNKNSTNDASNNTADKNDSASSGSGSSSNSTDATETSDCSAGVLLGWLDQVSKGGNLDIGHILVDSTLAMEKLNSTAVALCK